MSSIFERLQFNFPQQTTQNIPNLSEEVIKHMDSVKILTDWQIEDLANDNASGYFRNPVGNVTNQIISLCSGIASVANTANVPSLEFAAISCSSSCVEFKDHTERMTNLKELDEETSTKPHYKTSIGIGRMLIYVMRQNEDISNAAPILGSFTSVMIESELDILENDLSELWEIIQTLPPDNILIPPTFTAEQTQAISDTISKLSEISNLVNTRKSHDENFYDKSRQIAAEISELNELSNMGESQNFLMRNFLGTPKLIERLDK